MVDLGKHGSEIDGSKVSNEVLLREEKRVFQYVGGVWARLESHKFDRRLNFVDAFIQIGDVKHMRT